MKTLFVEPIAVLAAHLILNLETTVVAVWPVIDAYFLTLLSESISSEGNNQAPQGGRDLLVCSLGKAH